jgi:signal transduction histidine kinase
LIAPRATIIVRVIRHALAELARLRNPRTLLFGVISGYALTACFAILLWIGIATDTVPWHSLFGALLAAKLLTNTLAFLGLRFDRFALELGGLNVVMDVVVMTGAIWATGDIASPIVAIYTIEVTVLALLTNATCTVLISIVAIALFITMGLLTTHGILPSFPTPAEWSGRTERYFALACAFTIFVVTAPTLYTTGLLRRLRDRERALEAKTVALVDAGKQKAQFMANITHELRTPLQGIMGLSDLVAKGVYGPPSDRQRQAMADIKTSAKRLHVLIDDLLQLATHDAGKLDLKLEPVALGELVTSTAASAQWLLGGKQLTVTVDVAPDIPTIRTDRTKVTQILINLLSNAIKFTPDGGSITLHALAHAEGVELAVADTGVGIPAEALARIFDEFYQVDGSPVREYGGVGLGLALVKRLAELLGGSVAVESQVERGSRFSVRLPLNAPGSEAEPHLRAV